MLSRTRVKFCGICRLPDAELAVDLGVDALGFVFYRESPRFIEPQAAGAIIRGLPPMITTVGLFVDAPREWVQQVVTETGIDLIQYHGSESGAVCAAGARPYIKALHVNAGTDFAAAAREYTGVKAFLLDTYHTQLAGGTGLRFDWSLIPAERPNPVILAGGLSPANVADAIARVRPYAVDVSGGIESTKGVKNAQKMRDFIAEVRRVERATDNG
ncbi:MAG: phosphoribosylanthranilate isomerase [Gammaproteobacteria bacterium]